MNNESSGFECSSGMDVIFGEAVPRFDMLIDPVSNKEDSTLRPEIIEIKNENGDSCDLVPPVIGDSTDQNIQSPDKGKTVVVQQKYGASMYHIMIIHFDNNMLLAEVEIF